MTQPLTLKEVAYEKLRKMILSEELKPGEFLSERALVDRIEMSRTPIRSALERLQASGLLSYIPGKGLIVTELSVDKVVDFYDIRVALEGHVTAKLALRGLTDKELAKFEANLKEQEECVDSGNHEGFTVLDSQFHRLLTEAYGNHEISATMDQLQDKLYRIALKVLKKDQERLSVSFRDHERILQLIQDGDAAKAQSAMAEHLEYGRRILVE